MPTFGDLTAGGDTFPCSDGRALVDRFTLTEAATVTGIYVNFSSGTTAGTSFKGLILADSSGLPGSVLVVGTATAVPAGGGYIQSPASVALAAGDYWIGYVANSFQASSTQDASGTAPNMQMANGTFSYSSPPATWPGSSASYGGQINAYVEYTAAGGGAYSVTAETGSFTETGTAASLEFGRVMPADGGSYALTGANAGTLAGRRVTADTGSLALAGTDAAAEFGRLLAADLGAYALTGTDAGLSRTVAGAYALSAEAGAFALSGGESTLTGSATASGGGKRKRRRYQVEWKGEVREFSDKAAALAHLAELREQAAAEVKPAPKVKKARSEPARFDLEPDVPDVVLPPVLRRISRIQTPRREEYDDMEDLLTLLMVA